MPQRRCDIVDAENPGVYHCISRCVRREALLSCPTRRAWIVARLDWLAARMAVDVISFAVMENHLHLLLRIRPDIVRSWTDHEVARLRLALLPNRRRRARQGLHPDGEPAPEEIDALASSPRLLERARRDLSDLGFFHRLLKEPCARLWNREDGVTGHFWEGRFLSPRVLDEAALLRVARYVELNEVRAARADSVRASVWTSARRQWERLRDEVAALLQGRSAVPEEAIDRIPWDPVFPSQLVLGTRQSIGASASPASSITLVDYLATLEFVGRCKHPTKPGWIRSPECSALEAVSEALRSIQGEFHASVGDTLRCIESKMRIAFAGFARRDPDLDSAGKSGRHVGSCYGSGDSLLREAARRGVTRVAAIPMAL